MEDLQLLDVLTVTEVLTLHRTKGERWTGSSNIQCAELSRVDRALAPKNPFTIIRHDEKVKIYSDEDTVYSKKLNFKVQTTGHDTIRRNISAPSTMVGCRSTVPYVSGSSLCQTEMGRVAAVSWYASEQVLIID